MTLVRIEDARPEHIVMIRDRLRTEDALEITCLGVPVRKALWRSYKSSLLGRVGFVDGEIAAVWGCGGCALGGIGTPWLMTTPVVERVPVSMVKVARREMMGMLDIFPVLENYVAARYQKACRFLEVLGFELGDPIGIPVGNGRDNVPFRPFRIER